MAPVLELRSSDLVDLACDCCGKRAERLVMTKRGTLTGHSFRLVQCANCGFLYFNPRPSDATITRLYDAAYYEGEGFDPATDYASNYAAGEDVLNQVLVGRLASFRPAPARMLDFGCGLGDLAQRAKQAGYDVEGYEISSDARKFCGERDLKVYGTTDEIPAASYDIVTAVEVIEHAYVPKICFAQIYAALKPGGIFLYTTQNPDIFLWKKRLGLAKDDSYLLPEGHLNFYNRGAMKRYLRAAGFSSITEPWMGSASPLKHKLKDLLGLHLPSGIK
jgi:SAM-dependent methyltransferase